MEEDDIQALYNIIISQDDDDVVMGYQIIKNSELIPTSANWRIMKKLAEKIDGRKIYLTLESYMDGKHIKDVERWHLLRDIQPKMRRILTQIEERIHLIWQ